MKVLIRSGADVEPVSEEVRSAIHWALEKEHFDIAEMLMMKVACGIISSQSNTAGTGVYDS